jgi:hypothetical protein
MKDLLQDAEWVTDPRSDKVKKVARERPERPLPGCVNFWMSSLKE